MQWVTVAYKDICMYMMLKYQTSDIKCELMACLEFNKLYPQNR